MLPHILSRDLSVFKRKLIKPSLRHRALRQRSTWNRRNSTRSSLVMCVCASTLIKPPLLDLVPGSDQESSVSAEPAERLVVMEIEVTVHLDRIDQEGTDEVVNGSAASIHGSIGLRRNQHADERSVAVERERGDARRGKGDEVRSITTLVQYPIASDGHGIH